MSSIVERALRLWTEPLPEGRAALDAFRGVYSDPLAVNGEPAPLQLLVDRARMLQSALEGVRVDIQEQFAAPGRHAFAFQMSGRHVRPLVTPLGEVVPSGAEVSWAGLDIFIVDEEDRVTGVWAIADLLTLLMQADAVALRVRPARKST